MSLCALILFAVFSETQGDSCRYAGHDLAPFRNVTLTSLSKTGGKYELSLCGPLKNVCIDSLTKNKMQGKVFSFFGEPPFYHCWDVLVLPDVVPTATKTPDGLNLQFTRNGDAHLSCNIVAVDVTIICDPQASPVPANATMTGIQDGCTWRLSVKSASSSICSPPTSVVTTKNMKVVEDPSIVTTPDNGPLRGVVSATLKTRSFLGVPYAQPPTGDHRWKPPRPLKPRLLKHKSLNAAPRDATVFGSSCWQQGGTGAKKQSEDCLFLNIYAPIQPIQSTIATTAAAATAATAAVTTPSSYPVLFWIHGGCYVEGTPNQDLGNGTSLVEQFQDVIVVSVTYRLNAFGFLGSNDLRQHHRHGKNKWSTGNWGIQDQRLAMKWVQRNIVSFGGDPSRVMIFGQSAGAGSVATHLVTKKSWGLFSRAVMESGSYANWIAMDLKGSEKNWKALTTMAKCKDENEKEKVEGMSTSAVVDCMRRLPASTLANLTGQLNVPCRDGCTFAPVVDGVEMKKYPWELIAKRHGRAPNVPIMHGTNLDDGLLFVNMSRKGNSSDLDFWITKMYGHHNIAKYTKLYPTEKYPTNSPLTPSFWAADRIETDFAYFCAAHRTSWAFERGGGFPSIGNVVKEINSTKKDRGGVPVYQYRFAQKAHKDTTVLHGDELPFVWLEVSHESVKEQPLVAQVLATMWTNFARTGNPNFGKTLPKEIPYWPKWSSSSKNDGDQVFQFQEDMMLVGDIDRKRCNVLDKEWREEFGRCLPCTIEDENCN